MSVDLCAQFDHLAEPFEATSPEGLKQVFHRIIRDVPPGGTPGCRIPMAMYRAALQWTHWIEEGKPSPEHRTAEIMRQELVARAWQMNLRVPYVWLDKLNEALEPIVTERQAKDPESGIKTEHRKARS